MSTGRIVAEARRWIGTPYRHQASTLGAGCDCLGLIRGIWRALHGTEPEPLPPYGADWRGPDHAGALQAAAERVLMWCEGKPQAGQVVLFRLVRSMPPRHCGVMVSDTQFVHAQEQVGVVEAELGEAWERRLAGVFDIPVRE